MCNNVSFHSHGVLSPGGGSTSDSSRLFVKKECPPRDSCEDGTFLRASSRIELPNPTDDRSSGERKSVRCAREGCLTGMPVEGLSLGSARFPLFCRSSLAFYLASRFHRFAPHLARIALIKKEEKNECSRSIDALGRKIKARGCRTSWHRWNFPERTLPRSLNHTSGGGRLIFEEQFGRNFISPVLRSAAIIPQCEIKSLFIAKHG